MKKSTKILAILIITIMMGALILRPSVYIQAAKDGLNLFAISVLPALLPFFIFTKLLTALGVFGKRLFNRSCLPDLTRTGNHLNPLSSLAKSLQNHLYNFKFVHIAPSV